jgi:hypothetical protein
MLRGFRKLLFFSLMLTGMALLMGQNWNYWGAYSMALAMAIDVLFSFYTREVFGQGGWFSLSEQPLVYWVSVIGYAGCSVFGFYWALTRLQ